MMVSLNSAFCFRFCGMCSVGVRKGVKYCWSCNADQTASGPPNEILQPGRADTSFGRLQPPTPTQATGLKRKAMSLNSYMKAPTPTPRKKPTIRKAIKKWLLILV